MATKGEIGAATAAPKGRHSTVNSSAFWVRLDPDILMASVSVWPSTPEPQTGSSVPPPPGLQRMGSTAPLSQFEQRLQEFAHRLARFLGGGRIAADMRIERDTDVLVGEGRLRIGVYQDAAFALPEAAISGGLSIGRYGDGAEAEQAGIEPMLGVRIFRQHHIAPGFLQTGKIGLAACDRVVVVGRAMKDPDRTRHGLGVGGIGGRAIRIERNIGSELRAGFIP